MSKGREEYESLMVDKRCKDCGVSVSKDSRYGRCSECHDKHIKGLGLPRDTRYKTPKT